MGCVQGYHEARKPIKEAALPEIRLEKFPDRLEKDTKKRSSLAALLCHLCAKTGEAHDIFLQGNILGITHADTLVLLAVTVPVLLVHVVFYKEFLFVSFDLDRPERGFIKVSAAPLTDVRSTMEQPPAVGAP